MGNGVALDGGNWFVGSRGCRVVLDAYVFGSYINYIGESWYFASKGLEIPCPLDSVVFRPLRLPPSEWANVSYDFVVYRPAFENSSSMDGSRGYHRRPPVCCRSIHSSMDTDEECVHVHHFERARIC